jgi:hypothetical protein
MAEYELIMGLDVAGLLVLLFVMARLSGRLHKLAESREEELSLSPLVFIWFFLAAIHSYNLFVASESLVAESGVTYSIGTIACWVIVNLLWADNLFATYGKPSAATRPKVIPSARIISFVAITISGVLLLIWPIATVVPSMPKSFPAHITLAISVIGAVALGIFLLNASRRAKLANKPS